MTDYFEMIFLKEKKKGLDRTRNGIGSGPTQINTTYCIFGWANDPAPSNHGLVIVLMHSNQSIIIS